MLIADCSIAGTSRGGGDEVSPGPATFKGPRRRITAPHFVSVQRSNPYNFRLLQSAYIATRMHQNVPYIPLKSPKIFWEGAVPPGAAPSPEPFPSGEGTLPPHTQPP